MESGAGINIPRRQSISDGKQDSPNLRDYLRIRQDENVNTGNNSNLTLSAMLKTERSAAAMRTQSNRTLMDIIREDPNGADNSKDSRKGWRTFKEKLRLRRQGSGSNWTSSVPVPASDVPIQPTNSGSASSITSSSSSNRMMMLSRRDSTRLPMSNPEDTSQPDVNLSSGVPRSRSSLLQRNESRAIRRISGMIDNARGTDDEMGAEEEEETTEGETTAEEEGGGAGGEEEQPVRMSLMALLAETDSQMGLDGSSYIGDGDDDDDDEEDDEDGGGAGYNNCCVCMVRHKGAAFIPCGHTFCRLCSRELWVQRGNCPLCNNFILEILDIF